MKSTLRISILLLAICFAFTACKKKKKEEPEPEPNPLATVSTGNISSVTATSAICSGNVSSEGTAVLTEVGICWSTSPDPTTLGTHTAVGSGTGNFQAALTTLYGGTTYYVRAYAKNLNGTAYGSNVSFKTSPAWSYLSTNVLMNYPRITNNTIYSLFNGIYSKSTDGITWTNFQTGLDPLFSIFSAFANGNEVYLTGQTTTSFNPVIYRSTDNGSTWSNFNGPASGPLIIFAKNSNTLVATTWGDAVYLTTDNGANWARVTSAGHKVDNVLDAGAALFVWENDSVSRSLDNGATWTCINNNFPMASIPNYLTYSNNKVFANINGKGVYVSTDNGTSWTAVNNGLPHLFVDYICSTGGALMVHTAGNAGAYISTDDGANWTNANAGLPSTAPYPFAANSAFFILYNPGNSSNLWRYKW
jgi:photosystem II stability/assembly factor-like uncharacterized protein